MSKVEFMKEIDGQEVTIDFDIRGIILPKITGRLVALHDWDLDEQEWDVLDSDGKELLCFHSDSIYDFDEDKNEIIIGEAVR